MSLAAFTAVTVVLIGDAVPPFQGLDASVTLWALEVRADPLTAVAVLLHHIGQRPWGVLLLAAVAAPLVYLRRWWSLLLVLTAWLATSAIAVKALKELLGRERPVDQLIQETSPAFPSGHAAYAAVLGMAVVAVAVRHRGWALVGALLFTAVMGWSRIYLGVHWFSDTVAGALLGWGIALVTWWAFALPGLVPVTRAPSEPAPEQVRAADD
ncbi:undecaprenyl-diphosphatase [Spinactinospora alkalitolerans]|uniref:Undecaprenyl-diphosphatase n=1 Tax=Spinactinospora alkalitolerans TaxID=687207 RepID=A0A852TTB1_9ACTN|nr:phosphatase PAP2 family protein [Spinactinospora alkalitolerans]NYE46537.1 undecaprenyl-diphosphatase [Spinactinospora alkalitolerans]